MVDITAGGKRDRLIRDAVATVVRDGLTALGWFDSGRRHRPVVWRDEAVTTVTVEVPLNTISVVSEDLRGFEAELGSTLSEDRWSFWVDFYAESEDLGKEMIGDVRDILRGKHPTAGREAPTVAVYDVYQDPVPDDPAFVLEIENVEIDRGRDTTKPFEQFWFACSFDVVDTR